MKSRVGVVAIGLFVVACGTTPPPATVPPPTPPAPSGVNTPPAPPPVNDEDFAYLEDVTADKSIAFAKSHNAIAEKQLTASPMQKKIEERMTAIMSSKDKIPGPYEQNGK